jgi:hypothetical protein
MLTRSLAALCMMPLLVSCQGQTLGADGEPQPWLVHASSEDFRKGTFGDSGVNTYVSATGGVQMIHRWDLNSDGYLDLVVGQSHNASDNKDALLYWGTPDGPQSIMPPMPELQPLGRLLHQIRLREKGVTRLVADGGGRSLSVDLNGDGWQDIVFCNFVHNHDVRQEAYVYLGSSNGFKAEAPIRLPTLSASAVAAADFNRDGFVDLCFANGGSEMGGQFEYDQHLESYIYWNGPLGFSEQRRTSIPSVSAVDCAAGDINGDGYPELLIVNNHPDERGIYLYWNSAEGFSDKRRDVLPNGSPLAAELVDLNGDGRADLVALDRANVARIYLSNNGKLEAKPWVELPTLGAHECRAADLNKDGAIDLVFPNPGKDKEQVSFIYWGQPEGFSAERRMQLPTSWATDAAIADFNGDGWADIAFANERGEMSYDVNSYIYLNGPGGFHAVRRLDLQAFGPVSALADDFNRDGRADLLLVNRHSGATDANTPIPGALVYWGNSARTYSPAAMSKLPTTGDCHAVADLDGNGFLDIIFANGQIYYGDAKGYSVERRVNLDVAGRGVTVADLNRDGYLDLLMPLDKKGQIFWGAADGYRRDNSSKLPLETKYTQSAAIADLNKDGHLDLIFPDVNSPRAEFYWGDASGTYNKERRTSMDIGAASTVTIADVNRDGWLELVFGGTYDAKGRNAQFGVLLYGSKDGYSLDRSQKFEGYCSAEQSIADLNKDGYLDMVVSNYHGQTTRSVPLFIYWGDASGTYHESRRSMLPGESVLRVTVLDFNADGWLDIAAFNHSKNEDHTVGANIYWGSQAGYHADKRLWFPNFGVHFGERHNLGNIYDRRLEETYDSAPIEVPPGAIKHQLSWQADMPNGTAVEFQIRSAKSKELLNKAVWGGPGNQSGRIKAAPFELAIPSGDSWLQYRAILSTPDGGSTPVLKRVEISSGTK